MDDKKHFEDNNMEEKEEMELTEEGNEPEEDASGEENSCNVDVNDVDEKGDELEKKLEDANRKYEEYFDMLQRTVAEFDNYKKRTLKEKDNLYCNTTVEVAAVFLPVLDNLERALDVARKEENNPLSEGVELVYRQMTDVFKSLEVEEIKSLGESFNPELHNAVMHVSDDTYGENEIIEEFQKGYILKDKVLRHSVVKVAN